MAGAERGAPGRDRKGQETSGGVWRLKGVGVRRKGGFTGIIRENSTLTNGAWFGVDRGMAGSQIHFSGLPIESIKQGGRLGEATLPLPSPPTLSQHQKLSFSIDSGRVVWRDTRAVTSVHCA